MDPCENSTAELEAPLRAFAYFLGTAQAIYVSAPINSGWRFLKWYKEKGRELRALPGYAEAHAREAAAPNCLRVAETIAAIKRRERPTPVVDPTAFEVPGWSQDDYRCFWGKVIRRFVGRAILLDGWEASVGCVYEFGVAVKAGVPAFDEKGAPIELRDAMELIQRVVAAMAELRLETDIFELVLRDLRAASRVPALDANGD